MKLFYVLFVISIFLFRDLPSQNSKITFLPKDSIVIQKVNRWLSNYEAGDYLLFHFRDEGKIQVIHRKTGQSFEKYDEIFHKDVVGFGYQGDAQKLHIAITGCGKIETKIYSINLQDTSYKISTIKNLYGSEGKFRKIGEQYLALFQFAGNYFFIYDLNTNKLVQKKTKLPQIFEGNVTCQYLHPYVNLSFVNDTILAFQYIGQPTIYFMNKLHNYKFVSTLTNPIPSFNNAQMAFHFLPDPKTLQYKDIMQFIGNYPIFYPLNSFEHNNQKYFYQLVIEQSYDVNDSTFLFLSRNFVIWDNNFRLIKSIKFSAKEYASIDEKGIVTKAYFDEPNQRFIIYDCGSIFDYENLDEKALR